MKHSSPGQVLASTLRTVWNAWKRFGKLVGDFVGRVVLTLFYFTVLMPFGLGVRLWGDPLGLRPTGNALWLQRERANPSTRDARRLH